MATLGSLIVQIGADVSDLDRGISSAQQKIQGFGTGMMRVGAGLTAAVSAPLLGVGTAAIKASTELNAMMADVQSLGLSGKRVEELKGTVQDLAIATGKSTDDLARGLYQVVSAFGDTADTALILEINAKSAAAGLATTEEAIALTSSVTKSYGDTSAKAVGHTSDLAFVTVKLGQTTFPELASSMGRVAPIAANLGVSQEELFAVMATGTGVTGSAAEVSTQLRGVLQSLMAPTDTMAGLIGDLGFESGAAMIEQLGLKGSINAITGAAKATGQPLQKYIGSIEGQTLALALAGPQAGAFTEKLDAMKGAAGATETAFLAQTQGINKSGFSMTQAKAKAEVLMQKLGDGLAPALGKVLEILQPVIDKVIDLATQFANADPNTQLMVAGIVALAAAIGPTLIALGAITTAVGAISLPVLAVVAAVGVLAVAWVKDWGGIRTKTMAVWKVIQPVLQAIWDWLARTLPPVIQTLSTYWSTGWSMIETAVQTAWKIIKPLWVSVVTFLGTTIPDALLFLKNKFDEYWPLIKTAFTTVWDVIKPLWDTAVLLLGTTIPNALLWLKNKFDEYWPLIKIAVENAMTPITNAINAGKAAIDAVKAALESFHTFVSNLRFPEIHWPWEGISPPGWWGSITDTVGGWIGGNAIGTDYFRGGLTMVGERGPELVALPPGSSIINNRNTRRLATAMGGDQGVVINVNIDHVNDDVDVERMAYRIAQVLQRRSR